MDILNWQRPTAWTAIDLPELQVLSSSTNADVCIVGAGIAGLTTAYLLQQRGLSVIVLDDGPIASGQTHRTTAHLSNALDDRYFEVARIRGEEHARTAAEAHTAAIAEIERIVRVEGIDCDFKRLDGFLIGDQAILATEREAAHSAGLADVEIVPFVRARGYSLDRALRFPRQGQFHPLAYLRGLARVIVEKGGRIFANTHVRSVSGEERRAMVSEDVYVTADHLIVATNAPVNDTVTTHTKQAPYATYAIALEMRGEGIEPALIWDTDDPYHYVRTAPDGDTGTSLLIVGGEDHRSGRADDFAERYARLEGWARDRFGFLGEIRHRWSGQVMETLDGLAYIGRNPGEDNVYIATGDSGMGMTHGTIAGILISGLIVDGSHPWAETFDPARKPVKAIRTFVEENLDTVKNMAGWLAPGEVKSAQEIAPGHGAIIRDGMHKLAVFKDESGSVHTCSAVCPHLGCLVQWDAGERTWNCPCHGSRFTRFGDVINGPANAGLERRSSQGKKAA